MAALEKAASQDDGPIASINIIPFVDIVLVLLVIFIVTSAAIVRASLKVNLPRAAAGGAKVASTLNLVLDRGGVLTLDGHPTTPAAVRAELQVAVARDPAAQAVIAADRTVAYGKVMEVIDLVKGAGVAGFALDVERAPAEGTVTLAIDPRRPGPHVRLLRAVSCAPARRRRRVRRGRVAPLGAATVAAARAALAAARPSRGWWWTDAALWTLALAAHAVVAVAVWRTRVAPPVSPRSTRITVQVHDVPRPHPRPAVATPIASPRPSVPRAVRREAVRAPRAAEPVAPPAPVPVEVVGLSLESTSEAAQGPTFAVGGTLVGVTATTAARPAPAPAGEPPASPNRAARGLPRPGSVLTPPRRLREVKPRYPDARRASGVEADVLLVVSLDAAGRVLSVTVGRSSHDEAFDEAARQAAREERFSPALRDGVPVATTFSFTTHFRLDTP